MNPIIEQRLDKVQRQWKWLKFGQHLGTAGLIFCLLWFLIQWGVWRGMVTQGWVLAILVTIFVLVAFLSLSVLSVYILVSKSKRDWAAGVMEKARPGLMDRVNTLIFLEGEKPFTRRPSLAAKIQEQAAEALVEKEPAYPFSPSRTLAHLGIFLLGLVAVIYFQVHYSPFSKLQAESAPIPSQPKAESLFELKAGNTVETAEKKAWGEVRIVEPGRDLKMTKVDVVPLQIEMTASEAMAKPAWITSLNGGEETRHELAVPTEPNYAVYQPLIYLDELGVSDWDVISYFARVESCAPAEYTSKIYFIEIRPFRDDILKMTGGKGEGSKAYDLLSEVTGLVKRQTEIIQETHQHQQIIYPKEELRVQDRKKLAEAEADLRSATNQLYAKIASEQENAPVGEILDHLAAAGQHMDKGAEALRDDAVSEGKKLEEKALAELIATRKAFQKVMTENPNAFGSGENEDDEESISVADSQKALQQVSEMKDREQAALNTMKQLTAQQQALTDIAKTRLNQADGSATTSKAQADLKNKLERLIKENPDLFRETNKEQEAVKENMDKAIESLNEDEKWGSRRYMTRTSETMRDLEKVVEQNHQLRQLTQAYELKKIIDQNIKQLKEEEGKPGGLSKEEAKSLADSAQRSTGELKEIVDSPGVSGMGSGLGDALSAENQEQLQKALEKFSKAESKEGRQQAAGEAGSGLAKVSEAFNKSRPELTKQMRGQDSLQPQSGGDALGQAEQQLRSMLAAEEQKRPMSPEMKSKALADIMRLLKMEEKESKNTDAVHASMVAKVEEMLEKKKGLAIDADALKKLLDEIEAFRLEVKDRDQERPPETATTQIDPSKYPPSYRERIKRYFEQLSATPR